MKFIYLVILILAILSVTFERRVRRHKHRHHRSNQPAAYANNKWAVFFRWVIQSAVQASDSEIQAVYACFPSEWKKGDNQAEETDQSNDEPQSTLDTILDVVQQIVGLACRFKDKIIGLLKIRRLRRQLRLFLQHKWFLSGVVDSIKSGANWLKDKVGSGLKAIGNFATATWDKCVNFFNDFIASVKTHWFSFVQKCKSLFKTIKMVWENMKKCFGGLKNLVQKIIQLAKDISARVTQIATIVAGDVTTLARLFVDMICKFEHFRTAITALVKGIAEKDTLKKYQHWGVFVGTILQILS